MTPTLRRSTGRCPKRGQGPRPTEAVGLTRLGAARRRVVPLIDTKHTRP